MKAFLLTSFALTAFAFNSILCRLALGGGDIDPAAFTAIRLVSGAIVLATILRLSDKTQTVARSGNWTSAFCLFAYAITFSFAYVGLTTATGALILFGFVQITMITLTIWAGVRPSPLEWSGLVVAFGGLIYLVLPGLSTPSLISSVLMAVAGISWGFYSLRGKQSSAPLADTTRNFIRAVPMAVVVLVFFLPQVTLSTRGAYLAVLSGAIASGIGYTVWYVALNYHTATRAAVLQLSVPVIAAGGGWVFMSETAELRLLIAAALVLGGIALTIAARTDSTTHK